MSKPTFRASNTQQGLTENMQILTGQKGDRLDKALTLREAAGLGMINLRRTASGSLVPELPPANKVDPEWSGVQPPHAPVNVTVSGAFHTIVLTWDAPTYWGHAFAEVWRSEDDNLSHAVRVGATLANVYADAVGKEFAAFYWVRFVNKNDMEGPYQGTEGLHAETSRDVQDILDELQGKIEASHLVQSLLEPIQQVPQLSNNLNRLGASFEKEVQARTNAEEALAKKITQVTAGFKEGDTQLAGQITTEAQTRASADGALGKRIDTVNAKAGELGAAVQQQSQAIAELKGGAQAMWTVKANAGDITAGIGLVAKDDGTSQVALSASQVFVFDPNSATPLAPLFAIDNGQTVIAEAIIRKATIQIIHSEKITADYIKAGSSISAPLITGGQIDMGNAFMAGGAAGFGKGGPYGGWSWGWHTIIYSDGSLYTNRLRAEGGYVKNMVIGNCTIEQDCIVKGTVYAERIVGDVYVARDYACVTHTKQAGPIDVCRIKINQAVGFPRTLTIPWLAGLVGCSTTASGGGSSPISSSNSTTMQVSVLMDGEVVKNLTAVAAAYATSNPSQGPVTNVNEVGAYVGDITIPANREPVITIRIQRVRGDGWVRSDPSQNGRVVLFKQGGSLS
ncbi:phage tail tip fiber protein [Aeromonas veronii]|uniref:phage tail tip fiber protein n=1 Tax=Aeromonas veronii TaxID=654 RepID=UPI0031FD0B4A